MNIDASAPRASDAALRSRNRRVALLLAAIAIVLLAFCVLYIRFFGGTNKGPMQPYHSSITTVGVHRA